MGGRWERRLRAGAGVCGLGTTVPNEAQEAGIRSPGMSQGVAGAGRCQSEDEESSSGAGETPCSRLGYRGQTDEGVTWGGSKLDVTGSDVSKTEECVSGRSRLWSDTGGIPGGWHFCPQVSSSYCDP